MSSHHKSPLQISRARSPAAVLAANTTKGHPQQQLLLARAGRINVFEPEVFGCAASQGSHGFLSESRGDATVNIKNVTVKSSYGSISS